ncbi:1753_t:CDS:2, partial [Gigaspora rosea]
MSAAYLKLVNKLGVVDPQHVEVPAVPYENTVRIEAQRQVIEAFTTSPAQRTMLRNRLTRYYALAVTHTYYIFRKWSVEQIMRTKSISLRTIIDLSKNEF